MIQSIRGFRDILPGESEVWQHIETVSVDIFQSFGFKEIRLPVIEKTELFARSIGEDTDIVEKEMYTFSDRKGDMITLRPEATASIVRAYIQHKMYASDPIRKFYTIGPMFRRERPQKGRYRQFFQINAEIIGTGSPYADAQLIYMLMTLITRLNVRDVKAHINSLGCTECRPVFREALTKYLSDKTERLCEDCIRRKDKNPLRVLDCKVPGCREAVTDPPAITDHLCPACADHFQIVQTALTNLGISFILDSRLVRGLDYYTRTTFEIQTGSLGAQSAVAGGGRYDGLIKMLGGPDTPATGFAIGFDRLAEIVGLDSAITEKKPDIFIAALGEDWRKLAFEWQSKLSINGIFCELELEDRSLKSLMKRADKLEASHVLIFGENELKWGKAVLRNMASKDQIDIPIDNLPEYAAKWIGKELKSE